MLITVIRTYKDQGGSFGNLTIDTVTFKSSTLENSSLIVPAGVYDILFMWSEHFQQIMPHVIVPGRTAIEIHWANWPQQLEGCLAVGKDEDFKDGMITQSKDSWIAFVKAISDQPSLKIKYVDDYGTTAIAA